MDGRLNGGQLTVDRSNFWGVVERTRPSKLYLFSESELKDCQEYFLKVQSDPTVPANELVMAAERLTLIRSEIDTRHGDAKYRRAQRLAWSAIGLALISTTCAVALGVRQFVAERPSPEILSAALASSPASMAVAVEMPIPAPKSTAQPSPTPDVNFAPVYAIEEPTSTPARTPSSPPRTKHRTRRPAAKKANTPGPVGQFFRSLFPPRPTQTPFAGRRR